MEGMEDHDDNVKADGSASYEEHADEAGLVLNSNNTLGTVEDTQAKKKGFCITCGVKTREVTLLSTKPRTNEDAYQGICIRDNPSTVPAYIYQEWESKFQPSPPPDVASACRQELHDNNNDVERGELQDEATKSAPNIFVRGGVAMKKSPSLASMASEFPSEEPNNVARILPEDELYAKKDLEEQMIVPTQSPSFVLGDVQTQLPQLILEATSGAYNNTAAAAAAPNSTQMFPGAIRMGFEYGQHVEENHHSLLPTVAHQNIVKAPTTTMVEEESVDLVYGVLRVAETVNVHDASLIPTAAGGPGASEQEGNVYTVSKQSMRIMVGMVLLLIVNIIVVATVGFVSQNKSAIPAILNPTTPGYVVPFTPAPVASRGPHVITSVTPAPVVPVTPTQPLTLPLTPRPITTTPSLTPLATPPTTTLAPPMPTPPPTKPPVPATPRPTSPPITPMPTVQSLQLICAWIHYAPTTCPTASSAEPPFTTATGTIPSQIGLLTSLTFLNLWGHDLIGSIPSQIGQLTSLMHLYLGGNALTGSIPSQIGLLTSLMDLGLENNALSSSIPSQIGQLTNLTGLYLWNNTLNGSIPSQIGLLMRLKDSWLHNNALTAGTIPSSFCNGGGKAYIDCEKITTCSCCYDDWKVGDVQKCVQ